MRFFFICYILLVKFESINVYEKELWGVSIDYLNIDINLSGLL